MTDTVLLFGYVFAAAALFGTGARHAVSDHLLNRVFAVMFYMSGIGLVLHAAKLVVK